MINNSGVDSSTINQVINKVEPNNNISNTQRNVQSNVQSTELKNENLTVDSAESIKEINAVNAVEEAKETEESADTLEQAFEIVSDFLNVYNRNVNFAKDDESDTTIIQIFDSDTNELIKQFPSADLLELANKIADVSKDIDLQSGVFFDEKV